MCEDTVNGQGVVGVDPECEAVSVIGQPVGVRRLESLEIGRKPLILTNAGVVDETIRIDVLGEHRIPRFVRERICH